LGLPSPGQIKGVKLPDGTYYIDSFFDITYVIEFVGAPGSALEGMSESTTATIRLDQGGPSPIMAGDCVAPDNGTGTADLHRHCPYTAPNDTMYIIDGLPPGTTIECDPTMDGYVNFSASGGGSLGGEIELFDAYLELVMTGTGSLTGYNRLITVPIEVQTHSAPRALGDPTQDFMTDMYYFVGVVFGDPDFDQLIITAGTGNGLPSPGNCTLTELPNGNFNVESFFDVTYQIDFVGAPGSILEGQSGSTIGTVHILQGSQPGEFWTELYEPPDFQVSMDMSFVINALESDCVGLCGDANNDGSVNVSDAVFIINYVFSGGPAPYAALACGDANTDGSVNVSDAVYIINYVFSGGSAPANCTPSSPNWLDGDCCPFIFR